MAMVQQVVDEEKHNYNQSLAAMTPPQELLKQPTNERNNVWLNHVFTSKQTLFLHTIKSANYILSIYHISYCCHKENIKQKNERQKESHYCGTKRKIN